MILEYLKLALALGLVLFLILLILIILAKIQKGRSINTRDALLTIEELEYHAKQTALEHSATPKKNIFSWPVPRLNDNYNFIFSVYQNLNEDIQQRRSVPAAAEWLLDNFYIIEEQVKSIRQILNKKNYYRLPILKRGPFKGYTRVHAIAIELVAHIDGQIEEVTILKYLTAYQSHNILFDREIWAIPIMIRLVLIESIRNICQKLKDTRSQWSSADDIIEKYWSDDSIEIKKMLKQFEYIIGVEYEDNFSFIEHLFYRLRRFGRSYSEILKYIDKSLDKFGITAEEIAQKEHNAQAVNTVSMGNCITSIKYIATHNWMDLFESVSYVEQMLKGDPYGIYGQMDMTSRNYYRGKVEMLAKTHGVSEIHIAREAVAFAQKAAFEVGKEVNEDRLLSQKSHVGYYLIGDGVKNLESRKKVKVTAARISSKYKLTFYCLSIIMITLLIVLFTVIYSIYNMKTQSIFILIFTGFAVLIPASEMAISLINWIACRIQKPTTFARLELKDGIPDNLRTMVVIPVLLTDEKRVEELLQNMENLYLSNREENLYFAIIGAFKDSSGPDASSDKEVLRVTFEGIKELNHKYAKNGKELFYFYHRSRKFNESDNIWTGWERKRGALMEFNELLLGGSVDSSFSYYSNTILPATDIKYVITLDADTVLPMGMARKMIGTMAHPLYKPVIDSNKKIVVEGHGLMQPRISFDIDSSNRSAFSRIFTGQEGIDPYAGAISDVYQDLFGEGIFTGKGIYDLQVFQSVLKGAVPENAVLSHDLLEGLYVRAALVTDLELVDSYPTKYNAYSARMYRWIRGDWQLIPWLRNKIYNKENKYLKNPLSFISRWKIMDNLRRSIVPIANVLLLLLGFCVLSGSSLFLVGFVATTLSLPFIIAFFDQIFSGGLNTERIKRHIPGFFGLKSSLFQLFLRFVFLPYQAKLALSAILITLVRVLITKKNMLEWVTSADAEKGQSNSLKSYIWAMRVNFEVGAILFGLTIFFQPVLLYLSLTLFIIWGSAPFIAYYISKDNKPDEKELPLSDKNELSKIARKTWRYFEEFTDHQNNYLAPDNYQVDPPRGIAYRTSPTNIGLNLLADLSARDLGYIGTLEMTEKVSNTISTIERMEKWNGHLYNWYDTRTLELLKPAYVSTVDSGNLVCYMTTLMQGLKEYLTRPLVDMAFVSGINDTLRNGLQDTQRWPLEFTYFDEIAGDKVIDLDKWDKALDNFINGNVITNVNNQAWKSKLERMANLLKEELQNFAPWIAIIRGMPKEMLLEDTKEKISQILKQLMGNICLEAYPTCCTNVILKIDDLIHNSRDISTNCLFWLEELRGAVNKANEFSSKFIAKYNYLIERINTLSWETKFIELYDEKKQLFSIGYNRSEQKLTNSYYDLLASESRQTSYIAIARGEIPPKHWFMLGRSLTVVDHYKGLVSWNGTMFEYLMPLLIMKSYRNTLLDETYSFVIKSQRKYAKQRRLPWGVSESEYNSLDSNLDYQYKAIGVPWLGLKRGLIEDAVIAPYATFLALLVTPTKAMGNIKSLKSEGLEGSYGFYEAADYTPGRLTSEPKRVIIKSFMAHHQGMSLIALDNYLSNNSMQKRFHSYPYVKAARLLLEEKVPLNVVFTKDKKEKIIPLKELTNNDISSSRSFTEPDFNLPNAHILSNGNYSVMLTDKGTGYSKSKMVAISRWREDAILDRYGMFFYIKNINTHSCWSAAYAPLNILPDNYEVTFTPDKAIYKRTNDKIETITEIVVSSGDYSEVRRLELKNHGKNPCVLELTSYYEVVLTDQNNDLAHPAFSNLFIQTEYDKKNKALIANRRPRADSDKSIWLANSLVVLGEEVGDLQFETDRMQFIGRGHTVYNPIVIERDKPLSDTVGPVLDPIFSLRVRVRIDPGKTAILSYVTSMAESKEQLLELIAKYSSSETCDAAFRLALTRSQVETKYLNINPAAMELYQRIISNILFLSPSRLRYEEQIKSNHKGQPSLWPFGISGDKAIVLVIINKIDEVELLNEVLKAHEFWRLKDIKADLVILSNEENSYTNTLYNLIIDIIRSGQTYDIMKRHEDVFILNANNMQNDDITLLYAIARIIFDGNSGTMEDQLINSTAEKLPKSKKQSKINIKPIEVVGHRITEGDISLAKKEAELLYFNGLGGFNSNGDEYIITLEGEHTTPAPWVNVIANPNFGFVVSESGGGFTFCDNSQENKLSPWSNDPVSDSPGEVFYLSDEAYKVWTITPLPIREDESYTIRHGFGYTKFEHVSNGISQSLVQFVPTGDAVKISIISLTNLSFKPRNIKITYYLSPVLGVSTKETAIHIVTSQSGNGTLNIINSYNRDFPDKICFMDASTPERSVTGDRKEFFGKGNMNSPEGLKSEKLSGTQGAGLDPCAAMQVNIKLGANETKEIVFILGMANDSVGVGAMTDKYLRQNRAKESLTEIKKFWSDTLGAVQVSTPDPTMNIMLNGWLMYQVISCRLWARSAFYQAGGAFGFRDQLQDCLSITHIMPETAKNQILKHAAHQFTEGDVLHWWHEPAGKGTRTKISDDFLWLPYVTAEYIRISGDTKILDIEVPFISDQLLKDSENERYCTPHLSGQSASLYEHCICSLENALKSGSHGLPLMGSGDWNDGMNTVGNKGLGESIWLGWFLSITLQKFAAVCLSVNDNARANKYSEISSNLVVAIEENGWDGSWYKRAFFDNGTVLGSALNSECKIDSLTQSWAVISGAGDAARAKNAMNSVEDYLVMRDAGLIKLLTPPFNSGKLEPGYIKGYVPGVRENGGQYTHAAAWVIEAYALLGEGDKACELFNMLNPINHTRTYREYSIYKVEPYVMSADVYGEYPHIGRGGWTWYTGSAGWMYKAGLENILGFQKSGDNIIINPCIPKKWNEYSIRYKYLETTYNIKIKRSENTSSGVLYINIDGTKSESNVIKLIDDKLSHQIEVQL